MGRILAFALGSLLTSAASQADLTNPAGLDPGNPYRLAFVTSTTRDATSAAIADYNAFVTAAANAQPALVALATTWTAIASTQETSMTVVHAKNNTATDDSPAGTNGVPIYLLDATNRIADDYDDLWDSTLDNPLALTETGGTYNTSVWTGTDADGTANVANALGAAATTGECFLGCVTGSAGNSNSRWIEFFPLADNNQFPLYAISGVLIAGCSGATSGNLTLQDDTVLDEQVYRRCGTIEVGPNYAVMGPNGDLTVQAVTVILKDDVSVGSDGTLVVGNDP